jgi:hypothetical protein
VYSQDVGNSPGVNHSEAHAPRGLNDGGNLHMIVIALVVAWFAAGGIVIIGLSQREPKPLVK